MSGHSNPATTYLERQALSAGETQRSALRRMVLVLTGAPGDPEDYPWAGLTYADVTRLRAALVPALAPATVNRYLSALRGVLAEAWASGELDADSRGRLCFGLRNLRARQLARGRVLAASEVEAMFAACGRETSPAGPRDGAILALMLGAGLRRDEVSRLDVADVDLEGGSLRVLGKGRAERAVPASRIVAAWLEAWLAVRGRDPGALLLAVRRGKIRRTRIGPAAVWRVVGKRAKQAGLERRTSPHDCRRTNASEMLEAGADLAIVGRLLGHANVSTTVRYDLRGKAAERRATELLSLPAPGGPR